jgi:hypothetical protein
MAVTDLLLALAAAVGAGVIAFAVWRRLIRPDRTRADAKVVGEFKNVFFNSTKTDRKG